MKDIKNKRTDDFQVTEVLLKYSKDLRSYILKYPENKLFKKIVTKNLLNNVGNLTVDDVENPTSICRKWLLNEGNFDVKALFVALYRIRNNLFHGNKLLNDIQTQHELFEIVINWLSEFLDSNNISLKSFNY